MATPYRPCFGKAIPYGVYDLAKNQGWDVGCDHDTAAFAVESIRRWWDGMGAEEYPNVRQLLICADGGGSNGYRVRLIFRHMRPRDQPSSQCA